MLTVDVPVLDTDMLPARFAILVANTSSLSKAYVSVNVEITESPAPVTSGFSIGKAFICFIPSFEIKEIPFSPLVNTINFKLKSCNRLLQTFSIDLLDLKLELVAFSSSVKFGVNAVAFW